jgi:hypothetical protein
MSIYRFAKEDNIWLYSCPEFAKPVQAVEANTFKQIERYSNIRTKVTRELGDRKSLSEEILPRYQLDFVNLRRKGCRKE